MGSKEVDLTRKSQSCPLVAFKIPGKRRFVFQARCFVELQERKIEGRVVWQTLFLQGLKPNAKQVVTWKLKLPPPKDKGGLC